MNDERLDRLIRDANARYAPPPLDTDALWQRVERARRAPASPRRVVRAALSLAAALLVGVALGRYTAPRGAPAAKVASDGMTSTHLVRPVEQTATALLGETVALLSALPVRDGQRVANLGMGTRAQELLVTTRLLLDTELSSAPRLHDLLEDLELVLSQIARLEHRPTRTELDLINEALEERDLVPRIRRVAATLAADD